MEENSSFEDRSLYSLCDHSAGSRLIPNNKIFLTQIFIHEE
jgi:hypothetical protein